MNIPLFENLNLCFILESQFALTSEYCSQIEEHTNDTVYTHVEKEVGFSIIQIRHVP